MKKLFFTFVTALVALVTFANEMPISQTYLYLKGRPAAMPTMSDLISRINETGLPLVTEADYMAGEYFTYAYVQDGKVVHSENISFSDAIVKGAKRHLKNPRTGESLIQVCGTQAKQILTVNNFAKQNCSSCSVDLSGLEASNQRIEDGIHDLKNDTQALKEGQNILWQQNDEIKKQNDYIIGQNQETQRQIRKARGEAWLQTGLTVGAVLVDGWATRQYVKRRTNRKPQTNYTIINTTTNNYNSGNQGGGPGEGHNGNGVKSVYSLLVGGRR